MRTVCGLARRLQVSLGRAGAPPVPPLQRPLPAVGRRPLLPGRVGEQRREGVRLDQVDPTTCGSAVLIALAAWADPAELARLDGAAAGGAGFGARYDARQKQVHAETNRLWPQALGTTPWAMVRWLHRNVGAAGRYRVRLVDDVSAADVADVLAAVEAALAAGRPVPLLVGTVVPRHYVLALGRDGDRWRVYEPTSGSVRELDPRLVGTRSLGRVLGFDRLHAALLPT
jgi:hypothetical protein